jgi:two-component system, OmpR family, KDP operon response regulator KdpE
VSGARVLVVDDEPEVRRALRTSLGGRGYDVQLAPTGEEALAEFERHRPDLVLLDLQLPGLSGLDVCEQIREVSDVPIIIMSVRGEEPTKVRALDLGADDYVTKPFGIDELLARMRAVLRRGGGARAAGEPVIEQGDLRIDIERREVSVRDAVVHLRPKEYEMLRYLAANAGKLITHRMLLRAVWGAEYEDARPYLHVHVGQLRRKIEPDPSHPVYILTEPGVGYRFAPQDLPGPETLEKV